MIIIGKVLASYWLRTVLFVFTVNFRNCEEGLEEAVTTLIWVAPRLQKDVAELRLVNV